MTDFISRIGFTGNYEMSLDAKGRLNIPAPFVKVLQARYEAEQENLVATLTPELSVAIYPVSVWEEIMNKFDDMSNLDQATRSLNRINVAFTFEAKPDGNNRIRLPQQIMTACGIVKDVKVIGRRNFFEIWNRKAWDEFEAVELGRLVETSQMAFRQR